MATTRRVAATMGLLVVAATWHAASIRLGSGVLDLVPFVAPGALIGLAVGWLSFAFVRREFAWRTGLRSALIGMVVLPPWLGVLVVLSGMTTAGAIFLLVSGAWAALGVGAILALVRHGDALATRWRARRHARQAKRQRQRRLFARWRFRSRRGGSHETAR